MHPIRDVLLASISLAAVSTFGDFLWAALQLRHRVLFGLVHGAMLCLCIGAAIGFRQRRVLAGASAGPVVGLLAAGTFYLLAPALGWRAMLPAWMLFWICFALLQGLLAQRARIASSLAEGLVAAVLSGVAFYAISGIWTRPSPDGPDYLRHFLSWAFAFLPGFAVLFRRPAPSSAHRRPA